VVNRTKNLKQLPLQDLRDKFEASSSSSYHEGIKLDVTKLKRKLDKKGEMVDKLEKKGHQINTLEKSGGMANVPEGKDGLDPQVEGTSTYDTDFVSSINKLGRQINSFEMKQNFNENALPLKQLKFRKQLYEAGETNKLDDAVNVSVHPQTLASVINDLHDSRISDETIVKNYNVSPEFTKNLARFKVAKNMVILEEKTKPDEIGHKVSTSRMSHSEDSVGEDYVDKKKLQRLKGRISMDD
jgi:hypothetical protein